MGSDEMVPMLFFRARSYFGSIIQEMVSDSRVIVGALITSGKRIVETASSVKHNTSVVLDLWAIKEFCQCAPEDLDRLAELLMEWDMAITAPAQWLVNLIAMIPKKRKDTGQ